MGRRYVYFCDECNEDFGNSAHLNIKGGDWFLSWAAHRDDENVFKSEWEQEKLVDKFRELHFCGHECFSKFVQKLMVKAVNIIEGGRHERTNL